MMHNIPLSYLADSKGNGNDKMEDKNILKSLTGNVETEFCDALFFFAIRQLTQKKVKLNGN